LLGICESLTTELHQARSENRALREALTQILVSEPSSDANLKLWARSTVTSIARHALTVEFEMETP
jgi:hypothetical protein